MWVIPPAARRFRAAYCGTATWPSGWHVAGGSTNMCVVGLPSMPREAALVSTPTREIGLDSPIPAARSREGVKITRSAISSDGNAQEMEN